jgi:hypothetical protein
MHTAIKRNLLAHLVNDLECGALSPEGSENTVAVRTDKEVVCLDLCSEQSFPSKARLGTGKS